MRKATVLCVDLDDPVWGHTLGDGSVSYRWYDPVADHEYGYTTQEQLDKMAEVFPDGFPNDLLILNEDAE